MMAAEFKKRSLVLLTVAYFLASQATVVCLVSEWYSSSGRAAVAWQSGPLKEYEGLSWTPRTHLPLNEQGNLSPSEVSNVAFYPAEKPFHILRGDQPPLIQSVSYFAPLSNKAPPSV